MLLSRIKKKNVAENRCSSCDSNKSGVILELSKEVTQDGFVREKKKQESATTNTAEVAATRALTTSQVQEYQTRLRGLGFYTASQDGNPTSEPFKQAVKNFQKVYGLTENGNIEDATTQNKIKSVYSAYTNYKSSDGLSALVSTFGLDSTQKNNFALTWTFLKKGMGLSDVQASGLMGNSYRESEFSSTNAQDSFGYDGLYDSNYTFKTSDGVGYGLLQWSFFSRKEDLLEIANSMGIGVGNINAQLALMKHESQDSYKSAWDTLKKCESCAQATEVVFSEMEQSEDVDSIDDRKNYTLTIYNAMT